MIRPTNSCSAVTSSPPTRSVGGRTRSHRSTLPALKRAQAEPATSPFRPSAFSRTRSRPNSLLRRGQISLLRTCGGEDSVGSHQEAADLLRVRFQSSAQARPKGTQIFLGIGVFHRRLAMPEPSRCFVQRPATQAIDLRRRAQLAASFGLDRCAGRRTGSRSCIPSQIKTVGKRSHPLPTDRHINICMRNALSSATDKYDRVRFAMRRRALQCVAGVRRFFQCPSARAE